MPNKAEQQLESLRERFAIVATGEGAQARIADEFNLRDQLHELMCVCGLAWSFCRTEGVAEAIETLDDENNWQNDDDGRPFSIHILQAEISDVMVYRLLAQAPSTAQQPVPKLKAQRDGLLDAAKHALEQINPRLRAASLLRAAIAEAEREG